jgi:hypothetical protein
MKRGGRAGEVIDLIDFQTDGLDHVVPDQLEPAATEQVSDVVSRTGKKVVKTNDFLTRIDQSLA